MKTTQIALIINERGLVLLRTRTGRAWWLTVFVLLATVAAVQAQFTYTDNGGGTCTITGYTGGGGAVLIPSMLGDLLVTSIGTSAFQSSTNLTSVTIPNNCSIGTYAFMHCTSLTSVAIPDNCSIGTYAFYNCTSLTSVSIPNGVFWIGEYTFNNCTSLTSVTIGNDVLYIENHAFYNCTSLTSVTIPNGVTSIEYSAFDKCTSLTNVMISDSDTSIGSSAFQFCTSLTSVTIPASVTYIGYEAFGHCTSLTGITVNALNSFYSSVDGVLFNKNKTTLIKCPGGKASGYTVPVGATSILDSAFGNCTSLTNVIISDSVTSIGDYAFISCTSLTSVYFKGNAPSPGSDVFLYSNHATVYYSPGTTGWPPVPDLWAGRPTALWLWRAVVQEDGRLGVQAGQFGFNINSPSGMTAVVEANTNLTTTNWAPVMTNVLTNGTFYFNDFEWTNYPGRFYRLRSQ